MDLKTIMSQFMVTAVTTTLLGYAITRFRIISFTLNNHGILISVWLQHNRGSRLWKEDRIFLKVTQISKNRMKQPLITKITPNFYGSYLTRSLQNSKMHLQKAGVIAALDRWTPCCRSRFSRR